MINKMVYWGFDINHRPIVGTKLFLTKVTTTGCSVGVSLERKRIEIGPIREIQQIAGNMSILWTDDAGYAVYYTES